MMTWTKALPVIAISFVFDALRSFFGMFWLFGPALAAAYCTAVASDTLATWTFGLLGTKTAAAACATSAAAVGSLLSAPLIIFGTVMGMAVGLFGWLTIGLVIMMTNARIFKEHAGHSFLFIFGLGLSEVPLIGALPALTGSTLRMYHTQIKSDKEALKKYEKGNADAQLQERREQAAELMQNQNMQLAQAAQQAEVDNETYAEAERAEEIPDELREAA